ncbi:MAG TPA: universal stress protein [Polyangiaceae bacterium]
MSFTNVLVPVDYSNCSLTALRAAADLAAAVGARLDVVHVWDRPLYVSETAKVNVRGHSRSLIEMIAENAEREMEAFLDEAGLPASVAVTSRLLSGEPARTLLAELAKGNHELVVVGTHGRTGLAHVLLGSVAEKLVRLSPVPVLAVPEPPDRLAARKAS